jgi:hypothetical protein
MFYYRGHALQFGGVNYLVPIDAKLTDETDLRRMTRVDDVVDRVVASRRTPIRDVRSARGGGSAHRRRNEDGIRSLEALFLVGGRFASAAGARGRYHPSHVSLEAPTDGPPNDPELPDERRHPCIDKPGTVSSADEAAIDKTYASIKTASNQPVQVREETNSGA